ncbi:MAG: hypothetical protein ABI120_04460 [Gemmatimonadaceae bacterium]
MSDLEHPTFNTSLPEWAVGELQRPIPGTAEQRQRIMELVRVSERPRRRHAAAFHPRWFRRGVLSPSGAAIAAAFTAMMTLAGLPQTNGTQTAFWADATIIRDTVVSSEQPMTSRIASAIVDTLRIVKFAINAPGATRVALSGEFNAWSKNTTWMSRDKKTGVWTARIAVPRHADKYAFVVDGDEMVNAPALHRLNADSINLSAGRADSI